MDFAVELYKKDVSGNDIAKKLSVSPNTVYRMLHESGVQVAGRKETKPCRILVKGDDAKRVIEDYQNGMSWAKLEEKYGYGQVSMREAIRRAGVKIKDHGGQRRRVYKEEEYEVVRLYKEERFTQAQICAKLNIGKRF